MRSKNDLIHIQTPYSGYIPQLSCSGPVIVPLRCPVDRCVRMVADGIELYEVDIASGRSVRLTLANVDRSDNFRQFDAPIPEFVTADAVTPVITAPPVEEVAVEEAVAADPVEEVAAEVEVIEAIPAPVEESVEAPIAPAAAPMTKAERKAAAKAKAEAAATAAQN